MIDQWYYRAVGEEFGPLSFEDLADLAKSGRISPDDDIRGGPDGEWVQAESIVGLFPEPEEINDLADLDFQFEETGQAAQSPGRSAPAARAAAVPQAPGGEKAGGSDFDLASGVATTASTRSRGSRAAGTATPDAAASEEWYCKCLGNEMGPMPFAELQDMSLRGTLSRDDPVRRGAGGEWKLAAKTAGLEFVTVTETPAAAPAPTPRPKTAAPQTTRPAQPAATSGPRTSQPSPAMAANAAKLGAAAGADIADEAIEELLNSEAKSERAATGRPYAAASQPAQKSPGAATGTSATSQSARPDPQPASSAAASTHSSASSAQPESMVPSSAAQHILASAAAGESSAFSRPSPARPAYSRPSKPSKSRSSGSGAMGEMLQQHGLKIVIGVGALVVVVVAGLVFRGGGSSRQYYDTLNQLWTEHKRLRSDKAPEALWKQLEKRAKSVSGEIINNLDNPGISESEYHILQAGYLLPKMVKDSRTKPTQNEMDFERNMKSAGALIAKGG